jgi:hypothetical protein
MAITCDWALFCEQTFFDPQRPGSLSISSIIEQAVVESVPASIGPIIIVGHLDGYGESMRVALRVTRPDGAFAVVDEDRVSFEHIGPYLLFTINRLEVVTEGRYRFDIMFEDEHVARTVCLPVFRLAQDGIDAVH